jgi:NADH-ubiquinone oxidoreductase chain 4L
MKIFLLTMKLKIFLKLIQFLVSYIKNFIPFLPLDYFSNIFEYIKIVSSELLEETKNLYFVLHNNHINTLDLNYLFLNTQNTLNYILLTIFLSVILFIIGIINIMLNVNNLLITLLNIELIFLGVSILFICISILLKDPKGQLYALLILNTAAAESAVGLGLLIALYRLCGTLSISTISHLRG